MKPIGLYLHIPFCDGKCPYCDFYSMSAGEEAKDAYTKALCESLRKWGALVGHRPVDTVYFGGGTPVLLGACRLNRVLRDAASAFQLLPDSEITVEANPVATLQPELELLAQAGFNRISFGMQSAQEDELRFLGRRHTVEDAQKAVLAAERAGFRNISLDLMLGLQGQTAQSAEESVDYCAELGVQHVSAYLLKVEEGTPFAKRRLDLPDEEAQREIYLAVCSRLEQRGFRQYEISNFSMPGKESRHNLKYWNDEEYLGLGPAAHSFLGGRRFYAPRDLGRFLTGATPIDEEAEEDGGIAADSPEEALMLRLRLTEGLRETDFRRRFGEAIPAVWRERAGALAAQSGQDGPTLLICDDVGIRLTREGFLVSNSIIARILG